MTEITGEEILAELAASARDVQAADAAAGRARAIRDTWIRFALAKKLTVRAISEAVGIHYSRISRLGRAGGRR